MRFLHTADWQLGMTRHFLNGDAQPRYRGRRIDVVRAVGRWPPRGLREFVVVCGDVFEYIHSTAGGAASHLEAVRAAGSPSTCCPAITTRSTRRRSTPVRCSSPSSRRMSGCSTGPVCTR